MERATVASLEEPQNIEEALTCENSKEWECAMQEEYDSLMTNNTWTLVPLPIGRKPCFLQMGVQNQTRRKWGSGTL